MTRFYERIERDDEEMNEYNRAKISEHWHLKEHRQGRVSTEGFADLKVVNKIDSTGRSRSYFNKTKTLNK